MTFNIDLPLWAIIIIIVFYVLEKCLLFYSNRHMRSFLHSLKIRLFYHNDEEHYKNCVSKKKAKQGVARERYKRVKKYESTSISEFLDKHKKSK